MYFWRFLYIHIYIKITQLEQMRSAQQYGWGRE